MFKALLTSIAIEVISVTKIYFSLMQHVYHGSARTQSLLWDLGCGAATPSILQIAMAEEKNSLQVLLVINWPRSTCVLSYHSHWIKLV
jgi:hypothetical protein